jgi:hypothetical protein
MQINHDCILTAPVMPTKTSTVNRTFSKGEDGAVVTDFSRTFANGKAITGGATITKAEGKVTVDVTRVGPNGNTKTVSRTFTPDKNFVPEPPVMPVEKAPIGTLPPVDVFA